MTTPRTVEPRGFTINRWLPRRLLDRFVSAFLRSRLHGLFGLDRFGMLLTYTGRRSGRRYTLPLAYMREGETVTTFALFTNTVWWKNLRDGAPVTLRLRGRDVPGTAEVVEDPGAVADGLLKMAEANPSQSRRGYYAVPRTPDGRPDREALVDEARTRVMIRVRLEETGTNDTGREFSPLAKRVLRALVGAHAFVYRRTGGRISGNMGVAPVLLLTTTGRKTGQRRTLPLSYLADGDRYVVVGAMGGAPKDPAWVHNLRNNPRVLVQVGAAVGEMRADVARGEERARLWGRINALSEGGFEEMQRKTERQFPVVVLSPEGRAGLAG